MICRHVFCFALLFFIARCEETELYLGDKCRHNDSGLNGTCELFQECPSDQEEFRQQRPSQPCDFFVGLGHVQFEYYLYTRENPKEKIIVDASILDGLNLKSPVKFLIHTEDADREYYSQMKDDYLRKADVNFIQVVWKQPTGGGLPYLIAATNTKTVGATIGKFIAKLNKTGIPLSNIHIIGHSLGAHVAGFAGVTVEQETGVKVQRISGLNPSGPAFEDNPDTWRLYVGDADTVDITHTDAGSFGSAQIGDKCRHNDSGLNATCELFQECEWAQEEFRQRRPSQTCSFFGRRPIVCCPELGQNTTKTNTTDATTRPSLASPTSTSKPAVDPFYGPPDGKVGTKSYEKCREYAKFANISYMVPGFTAVRYRTCSVLSNILIGGIKSRAQEFPHMAAIGYDAGNNEKAYLCSGSLISERFILTAGHCLHTRNYGSAKYVRLGDVILNDDTDDASPQDFDVIEIIRHPQYQPPSQYNDMGLLKLHAPAAFNLWVRPICLAVRRDSPTQRAVAAGWGSPKFQGVSSDHLVKITLDLLNFNECNGSYEASRKLRTGLDDKSQMCAGLRNEGEDICQGDSGGPLMIYHGAEDARCMYLLLGVTSFGKACGVTRRPGVYSRVYHYLGWIEDTVWP